MKTDYRFWEQNLNPVTMMPDDKKIYSTSLFGDLEELNKSQEKAEKKEENRLAAEVRKRKNARIKRVGEFW